MPAFLDIHRPSGRISENGFHTYTKFVSTQTILKVAKRRQNQSTFWQQEWRKDTLGQFFWNLRVWEQFIGARRDEKFIPFEWIFVESHVRILLIIKELQENRKIVKTVRCKIQNFFEYLPIFPYGLQCCFLFVKVLTLFVPIFCSSGLKMNTSIIKGLHVSDIGIAWWHVTKKIPLALEEKNEKKNSQWPAGNVFKQANKIVFLALLSMCKKFKHPTWN